MNRKEITDLFPVPVLKLPRGMTYGWKTVHTDLTTDGGGGRFQWPYPGSTVEVPEAKEYTGQCAPGLHLAKTIRGATSVGYRRTVLILGYYRSNVLAENKDKLRVSKAFVAGIADLHSFMVRNRADLRDAVLRCADLRGANLCDANLRGADLCDANLRDADLRSANLRSADLCGADLCDANLRGADLCGADLRDADLRGADLCGAILPIGFSR